MPSLERFFNPQMRVFSANITSMPSARLYFFEAGSTTPKVTYADKQGTTPNSNPVIASSTGAFPPIFLDGLYRAELRSSANIVQPGWPIDNVGQDNPIVPYAPWSEIVTYAEFERVTDPLTGVAYRSKIDPNLGNVPADSPSAWEVIADTVASSFTSDASFLSWTTDGAQISLDVDVPVLSDEVADELNIGTAAQKDYIQQDASISGSGNFISGSVKFSKVGRMVTISSYGAMTHASLSNVNSATNFVPVAYRPAINEFNVFYMQETPKLIAMIQIAFDGTLNVQYLDFTGAAVNSTSTVCPINISFNV